jgi:hypothetical protein
MRRAITLLMISALVAVGSASLVAQGKGGGPKTTTATRGPKTTSPASTTRGANSTPKGGPKTTAARGPQSTTHGNSAAKGKANARTTTTANTTASPNLPRNQRLTDRLRTLLDLPPGTDMAPYAAGFKNQGQFVAAVNVSQNVGINFIELKSLMVDKNLSLGQAIHQLKPGVNSNVEAQRAINQSQQR